MRQEWKIQRSIQDGLFSQHERTLPTVLMRLSPESDWLEIENVKAVTIESSGSLTIALDLDRLTIERVYAGDAEPQE